MAIFGNAVKRIQYALDNTGLWSLSYQENELHREIIPERINYWQDLEKIQINKPLSSGRMKPLSHIGAPLAMAAFLITRSHAYFSSDSELLWATVIGTTGLGLIAANIASGTFHYKDVTAYKSFLNDSLAGLTFSEEFAKRRQEILSKSSALWNHQDIADAVVMNEIINVKAKLLAGEKLDHISDTLDNISKGIKEIQTLTPHVSTSLALGLKKRP